jgi:hypothetical protein
VVERLCLCGRAFTVLIRDSLIRCRQLFTLALHVLYLIPAVRYRKPHVTPGSLSGLLLHTNAQIKPVVATERGGSATGARREARMERDMTSPQTRGRRSDDARGVLSRHRRQAVVLVALTAALAVFGLMWLEPQKLFIDTRVNEELPRLSVARGSEELEEGRSRVRHAEDASGGGQRSVRTIRAGEFRGLEHDTTGRASILVLRDGSRYLRFEDLSTSNGPELRVYLSEIDAGDDWYAYGERFIDLGALKGNVGDQNYRVPEGIELSQYRSTVIWCRRFSVALVPPAWQSPG